jgi:cyclopropane-fatty-acyl-phospholipid synthase
MWLLNRLLRQLVRSGELIVIDAGGRRHHYGSAAAGCEPVTVRFTDRAAPRQGGYADLELAPGRWRVS